MDRDERRAEAVCGEITRRALGDFAPALALLPAAQRRRVRALAAFGLTLFDFARQPGLDGERLAQINRWSFDLESTLAGSPPGQPVFVLLAATHAESPWPEEALLALAGCARRRALRPRAASRAVLERDAARLAAALSGALLAAPSEPVVEGLAALLRAQRLLALGSDRRRRQAGLARDELPEEWEGGPASRAELGAAVRRECRRLAAALEPSDWIHALPRGWRRAASYALLAARRLVRRYATLAAEALASPPRLGAGERLRLVLSARWRRL